jgi:hypothetical protein
MRRHPSRPWSIAFAGLAGLWALFLLPPQLMAWYDAPPLAVALDGTALYRGVHQALAAIGLRDDYMVFGAAISLSFALLWLATGPVLTWLGWTGRVFSVILLLLAPLTLLSYLNHPETAPLHLLWGGEAFGLIALGVAGVLAAFSRAPGVRAWERGLLAATLPVAAGSTVLFSYWPHGSVVGLAAQACVLAAFAPRHPSAARSVRSGDLRSVSVDAER